LDAFRERLAREGYGRVCLFSAKKRSLSALRALKQGYDFILGGGNLLQDATSKRSLLFYLFTAARASGRIEIHGGFGPLSLEGEEY
jgi:polysaccharide pyruvyl transferase WcaK-like protein